VKEIVKPVISKEEIENKVSELAKIISEDYKGEEVTLICTLKGAVVFMVDLAKKLELDAVKLEFIQASSYVGGTSSTGVINIIKDLNTNLEGKNVIIIEDIIDTGLTSKYLFEYFRTMNPKSLKICTLLYKECKKEEQNILDVDYIGFHIDDFFVIGYGLDYEDRYRNLDFVGELSFVEE